MLDFLNSCWSYSATEQANKSRFHATFLLNSRTDLERVHKQLQYTCLVMALPLEINIGCWKKCFSWQRRSIKRQIEEKAKYSRELQLKRRHEENAVIHYNKSSRWRPSMSWILLQCTWSPTVTIALNVCFKHCFYSGYLQLNLRFCDKVE